MFEVKFGTSEPVFYNEYWVVNGEVFEIEIDAKEVDANSNVMM